MAIDQEVSRRWRSRLRHMPNMDWDLIGLRAGPDDDEYEHYVGKVAELLREGVSEDRISQLGANREHGPRVEEVHCRHLSAWVHKLLHLCATAVDCWSSTSRSAIIGAS